MFTRRLVTSDRDTFLGPYGSTEIVAAAVWPRQLVQHTDQPGNFDRVVLGDQNTFFHMDAVADAVVPVHAELIRVQARGVLDLTLIQGYLLAVAYEQICRHMDAIGRKYRTFLLNTGHTFFGSLDFSQFPAS